MDMVVASRPDPVIPIVYLTTATMDEVRQALKENRNVKRFTRWTAAVPSLVAVAVSVRATSAMQDHPPVTWRSTFPECDPDTDGVALAEDRIIGRVRLLSEKPGPYGKPKPWLWSVTDPELAGRPGWADTHGETPTRSEAMVCLVKRWWELRDVVG